MKTPSNRQWRLAERPIGMVEERHFQWAEEPVSEPRAEGEILVRNLYLSCDPTQRGWISRDTYLPAVAIGEVVRSGAVGRVEKSKSAAFAEGDLVQGLFGWQDYALVRANGPSAPRKLIPGVPIELQMSALGMTGLTGYFGLLEVGRPQAGETVVVSGAAGATGSVTGQIARIKGCRAIGIAGGKEKCEWLVNVARLDAAVDYKSEDVAARLRELCPKGIDVYFDNVGGELLDVALSQLAMRGRIVLCGAIATYNDEKLRPGPKNYLNLIIKRGRMEGFLVFDYLARAPEAVMQLFSWVQEGKLVDRVDVQEGLENAPRALGRLFCGDNQGKQLVKIADHNDG
jgi:NADPH-dependent curcumin reductase CurA